MLHLLAKVDVRTVDGLHAKVWCFDNSAIIGSSNASTNGFGLEENEIFGNVEANVLIRDEQFVADVRNWFDATWKIGKKVTKSDIEDVRPLWIHRRSGRHRQGTLTLLGKLRRDPGAFKGKPVRILAYQ
jgi:phosphatidylserine/phosphatidylglycerophosphate/cardiolipin synthase-like enzyme